MRKNQENYFIDFLRLVFSLCILFYHSWIFAGPFGNGFFNHGRLAVDFFFIVTGYLMISSAQKQRRSKAILKDSFIFIKKKVARLAPALIVTFFIGAVLVFEKKIITDPNIILSGNLLPELFQLGIFGYDLPINSAWWYISAMLFVLALLYPLALKFKDDYCRYIAPLVIVIALGFVLNFKIDINDPMIMGFFLRNGFWKALIFIPLGNIAFYISKLLKKKKLKNATIIAASIIEPIMYVILIANLYYLFMSPFLYAILLTANIALTFSGITYSSKVFKHKIWKKLGNYGFYIFLCNIPVRSFIVHHFASLGYSYRHIFFYFITISCLVAAFVYLIVEVLYKKFITGRTKGEKPTNRRTR